MAVRAFEFSDQKFRSAAAAVDAVGGLIDEVLNTLTSAIDSRGTPWGNDQLGTTFYDGVGDQGGGYKENSAGLTEGIQCSAESIHGFSTGMINYADLVRAAEEDNRAEFGR